MSDRPNSQPVASAWSGAVNGLSARLRVELEDLRPGLRHAVYLEARNESSAPLAVVNQPAIRAQLRDSTDRRVSPSRLLASGPAPDPQWAVVPPDAYLGFRVDMRSVGVPVREQPVALIAVAGTTWEVGPGQYVLAVAVTSQYRPDGPANQWVGDLELPPVQIVVPTVH